MNFSKEKYPMKTKYKPAGEGTSSMVRESNVQYVVDSSGKSNFLLVRRKDWEDIHTKYRKLQKKMEVFNAIREGIQEVKAAQRKGKRLQSLSDFLDEC
jgi:hypothetical protein